MTKEVEKLNDRGTSLMPIEQIRSDLTKTCMPEQGTGKENKRMV